jgi:hypothetical protein
MSRMDSYRETLKTTEDWDTYLQAESGLPGPRGNIELAQAVALEGRESQFTRWLTLNAERAPTNSPAEFLSFCGVLGLGHLVARGDREHVATLRLCASDARWRMREGVAMALQELGRSDMDVLLNEMEEWSNGNVLEQRAAAAALCEPCLLRQEHITLRVLDILDKITASIERAEDRKSPEFKALRKGMGYCWSVAVAALPEEGINTMEKWLSSDDKDIRWIMKENLRKKRLERVEPAWVEAWKTRLGM